MSIFLYVDVVDDLIVVNYNDDWCANQVCYAGVDYLEIPYGNEPGKTSSISGRPGKPINRYYKLTARLHIIAVR